MDGPDTARVAVTQPFDAVLGYRELGPAPSDAPTLLLLHGSPGRKENFAVHAPRLARDFHVVVPDMLGFGRSSREVPDHSARAQATAMFALLDELGVEDVHVVGYSLGGAVALRMVESDPGRIASITLLSSIGVVELELLGDHHLNHALHGLQHGLVVAALEGVPHFGAWDGGFFGTGYTRSFLDTDQRPLRAVLETLDGPMLVIHGERDFLVPPEAAREHHRLVPQSELVLNAESHFMVFREDSDVDIVLADFVQRVEHGEATTRAHADPGRRARAAAPFDLSDVPPAGGMLLGLILVLLAASTLVSEDLTCLAAGLMVARGRLPFLEATLACFAGIVIGDMLLYLAGRWIGRPAVARAPLRWMLRPAAVERCAQWFARRGLGVVFISRFLPGLRLPTYFAAGILGQGFFSFTLAFLAAAALWTPLLVGFAVLAGAEATPVALLLDRGLLGLIAALLGLLLLLRLAIPLCSHRGRRMLVGRWRRLRHWEFWPPWAFYPPVVLGVLWLALKHRSLALVTAVNPSIPDGGFVGESKADTLAALGAVVTPDAPRPASHVAATLVLDEAPSLAPAVAADPALPDLGAETAWEAMSAVGLALPVVLKPDIGQRGEGVTIARQAEDVARHMASASGRTLIQEYVPGVEYGVFYVRRPDEPRGHVVSITEKARPMVTGDGERTLEELILDDERAVAMARTYFDLHADHLLDVPPAGATITLAELGTHCRGAIFSDGAELLTDALEQAVDELARRDPGFFFGRFDVRAPSAEAFMGGEFLAVELNGLTSEMTHVYDRRYSVVHAWRTLVDQWRLAFEIAAANRARGARVTPLRELAGAAWRFLTGRAG